VLSVEVHDELVALVGAVNRVIAAATERALIEEEIVATVLATL